MHGFTEPLGIRIERLWNVQGGLCFHCGEPMIRSREEQVATKGRTKSLATKEHVFPKSIKRGLQNNVVLAHASCNNSKGARMPTPAEIARTKEIYQKMGETAFCGLDPGWLHQSTFQRHGPRVVRRLPSPQFKYEWKNMSTIDAEAVEMGRTTQDHIHIMKAGGWQFFTWGANRRLTPATDKSSVDGLGQAPTRPSVD